MIWSVFILMTAGALFGVLWPFSRRAADDPAQGLAGNFYQAQVAAIERDRQAALISDEDARLARTEAGRRALADAHAEEGAKPSVDRLRKVTIVALMVMVPALAFGLYARIGSPSMPDQPLAARLAAQGANIDANIMIAKVEAHLKKHPDDVKGFELIAPVYLRLERFHHAAEAFRQILHLKGETAEGRADYAEALVAEAQGAVTPQAMDSFQKALKLDPANAKARFYQGLAAEQGGDKARALTIWQSLVASAPEGADWLGLVKAHIAQLSATPPAGPQGPLADAVRAMPANAQLGMIRGMVAKLSSRLEAKGDDPAGWQQLIRSLVVLKENTQAASAYARARQALVGNQDGLRQVDAMAQQLGLKAP